MDVHAPAIRSANMRAVPSQATKPERAVRAALLQLGQRFECNVETIEGKPMLLVQGQPVPLLGLGQFR